jgi:hypothetical protein
MFKKLILFFFIVFIFIITLHADEILRCKNISLHCGKTPTPFISSDGTLWIAFEQQGHVYVTSSNNAGRTFTPAIRVNNVAEDIYTNGENRPKIMLDSEQRIFVSWTKKTPGRFSGDIRFSRSINNGKSFSTPITVNTDQQLIGHRFDALAINQQDEIFIVWFDKRDQALATKNNTDYRGTALYYAVSNDHGVSFAENQKIADHSCECCRIALDFNQQNELHILWRHIFDKNTRDHALIKINSDNTLTAHKRVTFDDWHIDACPHHGPDLSIDNNENIHIAWYTQGVKQQGIFYSRIDKLDENKEIKHSMDNTAGASHPQVLSHQDTIYYAWKRFDGEKTEVIVKTSQDNGASWSTNKIIAHTDNASDHPLLVSHDDKVYLSWLSSNEGYRLIAIAN